MPVNAKVANHSGLGLQDTVLQQITEVRLNEASDVSLDITPQDVASLSRSGDDLVLTLQNGEVITLDGFYIDPQEQSHLYLEGDEFAGDIYRIDMASTSPGNVPYEAIPVENTIESTVLGAPFSAAGTTLAALGVIGATGLMLGGVNSDGGNDEDPNTSASPNTPIISSAADNVEPSTGELESGSDTNDTTPTLIGTAGAGSSVAIYDGNTLLDTVEADSDGNWALELTAPLTEGEHSLTAVATDPEGNISDTSDAFIITIDTLSPDAPELENTDGTTLSGTGEPGATVDITDDNGNPVATTEVGEDGTFSVDLDPMPEDGTELTATATDPAGNTSSPSNPVTVDSNTDTTPPAEGENSIAFGDGGDGFLNADEIGNVTLSGTIADGLDSSNVQLVISDGEGGSVTVDTADITVDGTTLIVAGQDLSGLAEGELTATLTVTDDSDNAAEFTADTVKDTITDTPTLNDTDGTTLSGTGEPGATVDITDGNGNPVATTEVGEDGTFSVDLDPMPEDGTELTATATDPAGNTSGPSNPVTVDSNTDTTPPAEGENSIAFGDGGDGFLNADEIGNVTLSGTIEDGLDSNNVQLVITDGEGGSVTVDTADITVVGTEITVAAQDLSDLAEGELTATLTVTDDSNNAAEFSDTATKDTTAPEAPVLEETDGTTLSGTGEPGATVEITDGNGNPVATTEVGEDGTFSVDLDPMPEDGTELTATATDPAGNTSNPSNPVTVDSNTDTTPPTADENSIAFGDGGDGFLNADEIGNVTLSGTIEGGLDSNNVQLVITDGEGGSVTVDTADITVDGTTLTVAGQDLSGLAEGELTATLTVTDDSDNAAEFTADTVKDTITDTPTLNDTDGTTLSGTGEPGATVDITDGNGNPVATTEVGEDGTFSVDLDPMPEDGTELTATATDPAGNTSGPSNPVTVDSNTDTTPPAEGENSIAFGDGGDGFLNADEIGNVTLSGTIEDGLDSSNVQLVISDGEGGSVTVDTADITVDGTTLTVAGQDLSGLAEGELTATLTVTDDSDNAAEFTADTVKDTITDTPTLNDTDGTTLSGTGEPGATVDITDGNGNPVATTEVGEDGTFSVDLDPMPEDGTELTATATDPAGNTSGPSNPVTVDSNTDTTPPAEGENSIAFGDGGDGFLNADEIGNVTLSGTIEDGLDSNNVQLVISDGEGGSVTVDTADITVDGTTLTVAGQDLSGLAEGELTATLTVTDDSDNAAEFTADTVKDTITDTPTLNDTDGTTLSGTGEPGATVDITDGNGNPVATTEVGEDGTFSVDLDPMPEDGTELTATATDPAGNTSGPSNPVTVDSNTDTTPPAEGENSIAFGDGGDGFLNADEIGNVTLSGTIEDGLDSNNVQLVITDGEGGSVTVNTADITVVGTEITVAAQDLSDLAEGELTATLTVTDDSDNAAEFSDTATKDTTAPEAPVLEETDGTTLTGTGEPGAIVEITDGNGNPVATTEVGEDGTFSVDLDPMPEDGTELTATATDPAGNTSNPSNPVTVDSNTDTTPPTADENSIAFGDGGDGFLNADEIGNVTLSGTIEGGLDSNNVQLVITDGEGGSVTVDTADITVDGTTLTVAGQDLSGLAEGELTATLTVTDDTGNAAQFNDATTKDTTSPSGETGTNAPALTIDEADDGVNAAELADGLQTNVTLTTGTEEGDTVTVTLDDGNGGTVTGTATVTADDITANSIAVEVTDAIADGSYTATAVITDAAGNSSAESNAVDVNVDTTSPGGETVTNAPALTIDEADDGVNAAELADGLQTSVTLTTGTEEGDTVTVTLDDGNGGTVTGTATVTADDITANSIAVEVTDAIADGSYTATAVITDAAGNSSAESNAIDVNVDATSPGGEDGTDAPALTIDEADDGVTAAELADGLQTSVTLTDGTEEGDTVTVTLDDGNGSTVTGTATVTADDITNDSIAVEVTDAIADGSYTATAVITDALGNSSAESNALAVNVDATSPGGEDGTDAPVLTIDEATDGVNADELADGLQTSVTLTDGTEEGDTVTVTLDDGNGGTVTGTAIITADDIAADSIAIKVTDAIADGNYTATAVITDALGNSSAESNALAVNVDATAPDAPILELVNDSNVDGDRVTNEGEVLVSGLDDDATWEYSVNGGADWQEGTGNSFVLGEGVYATGDVQARQSDDIGNTSESANLEGLTVDTTPPATPTISLTTDTNIDGDNITSIGEVTVDGLEDAATWEYSIDGGNTWEIGVGTTFDLDQGVYNNDSVQVRQSDLAGNTSDIVALNVEVDALSPVTTVTIDAISEDTGTAGDFITNDDDGLSISATLDAALADGETLQYSTDGTTWTDITDSVTGTTVTHVDAALTESATVQFKVQDAAGNDGDTASQAVVIDATAPTTTVSIDAISDDSGTAGDFITNDDDGLSISATLDAALADGETLQYSTDGTTWTDITDSVTGTTVTHVDAALTESATVQFKVQDAAGNDGDTASQAVVIDATAPTTTVSIDAISDDSGTAGDFITNDDDGLSISATLDAALADGETLQYSTDGTTWTDITDSVAGTTVTHVDAALTESATVQLRVQDAAGNTGPAASQEVVIDATAPTTTVTIDAISEDTGTEDDFITSDNDGLTITATLDAPLAQGETLQYSTDDTTWIDITDNVDGTAVSYADTELTESATVQLRVQDAAGNTGPAASQEVVIDATAPTTTVTIDAISEDTGTEDDFITSDNDGLTITATLDAPLAQGETLQYSTDDTTWIDITDNVDGTAVSYADTELTESATVQLRVQDAAGNTGPVASQDVVIDATAPTTTVTIDAISEDTGTAGDFITSDNDGLTITAILDAPLAEDETLQYSTDGTTWVDIPDASVTGTTVSYDSGLTESATVQLRVQDAAGNTGPAASQDVVIDATLPSDDENSITFADGGDGFLNADEIDNVALSGTIEDGLDSNNVQLVITDGEGGSVTVDTADITVVGTEITVDGQDLSDLAEGELTVTMSVTDEAGNTSDFVDNTTKDTTATLGAGSAAVTEDALGDTAPTPAVMAFSFARFAALPATEDDSDITDTVSNGQLVYTNVSEAASFSLVAPTDTVLSQAGIELNWVLSEDGKTLQAVNPDSAERVLQITIDDTGTYKTELFSTLDHSLQGEDSLNFAVGVTLTDGDDVLTSDIGVKVIDDTPELSKTFLHHDVTAAGDAVGDNLLGVAGFGADGGYISSITFDGVTFSIEQDALTEGFNVTTSGTPELLDLSTPVSVTNDGMILTTLLGETFTLDLVTGAYTYDYDGDLSIVDDGNTAPTPAINQSGGLLGIINLDALGLIDISEQQVFTVSDPDNDLTSVSLEYSALLSLTGFEWAYNEELATELGLQVTPAFEPGFLGLASSATLTITPIEAGSTMDAQAVNELLATVFLPDSVLGLEVVPTVTLSATDSEGTVDTSATELLDLSLLTADGSGANVLTGTDGADLNTLTAPTDTSTRLYGYDGNDSITGSNQADILRGGGDNDSMDGSAGSDLMIGGTGNDTMTGGDGIDIFRWEDGHAGSAGAAATDIITDFDPNELTAASPGDIIDLRTLLQGEGYVTAEISNLSRYLNFAEQGGDTVLSISTTGAFTGETTDSDLVDQIITFEGTSLLQGGEDSADLIARLISEGKLLVDEATSTTVLEDITREVDLTYTDGDGDSIQGKLEFSGDAPSITDDSNAAPTIVGASQQLLGLVGLDALGLVDLSQNALFVADSDGNLQSVTIAFSPLLNVDLSSLLGAPELTVNTALAEEFGLSVETTSSAGLLGLLAPSASVTISAAEGETIDNLQINELFSTLDFNQSDLLSLSLLDYLTVSATDDDGATTSMSLSSLLDANVLDSGEGSSVFIDETGADVLDASAAEINVNLYGLDGDDALTGGSGNDLLRGGEGNDTLTGGAGDDLLFGEAGDNTFDGGSGDDIIVTSTLDFSIDGGLGEDTVQFDETGESIDLSALLATDTGTSEMLNIEVLDISESSETGSTLTLDTDAVLNLTDDNDTLRIEGDSNDSVQADGAEMTGQEVINGATYDTYALGSATLYIDQDVAVTTNNA